MNQCLDKLQMYKSSHQRFFREPIVNAFLSNDKYFNYFIEAIHYPTTESLERVDKAFKQFYTKAKIVSYLSKMIYFNSIHFDKKKRKYNLRYPLIFDQPVSKMDHDFTIGESYYTYHTDFEEILKDQSIEDIVDSPNIHKIIRKLSEKQKEILKLYYIYDLKNKEIAQLTKDSPQNVSQQHKRALLKIKKEYRR